MIKDPSDPSGNGLFSRCARNHASKLKPKYRPPSLVPRSTSTPDEITKKKVSIRHGFDQQISREQWEKTHRPDDVPPVGHYHPLDKPRPKLVWDILKAYTHKKKSN